MGCEFPIKAYRSEERSPTGKRLITFNPMRALNSQQWIQVPCQKCMGCRLEKSRQWGVRMMHEAKLYDRNCFITLTYDNQHVPTDYSIDKRHWQLFMKKLRKRCPQKLRHYACGEYGDENLRPHYHAIIFNHDFDDRKFFSYNKQGDPIYVSEELAEIWGQGHVTTQDVTFKSARYVAGYVTKKITGPAADEHYRRVSPIDGNIYNVRPEAGWPSRRPGIGTGYVERFKSDFYPSGYIVVNGAKQAPPHFYLSKLSEEEQQTLKRGRKHRSIYDPENSMQRKMARSAVLRAKTERLKRNL